MPESQPYIVGRRAEIARFAALLGGSTKYWLLNIYGPGGIGKTVVGQRMQAYAQGNGIPLAFIDGIRPDLTPDRILYAIKEGLSASEPLSDAFDDFEREFQEYLIVQEVLERGGGRTGYVRCGRQCQRHSRLDKSHFGFGEGCFGDYSTQGQQSVCA